MFTFDHVDWGVIPVGGNMVPKIGAEIHRVTAMGIVSAYLEQKRKFMESSYLAAWKIPMGNFEEWIWKRLLGTRHIWKG